MGHHGDQFTYYIVTGKDPGLILLVITIIISVALYAMLPCMVACANRRDQQLKEQQEELIKAENEQEQENQQPQRKQKAYSREKASISGICDAQQGRAVKTIPNVWKHSSKLLNQDGNSNSNRDGNNDISIMTIMSSHPMHFLQVCIQKLAKATHKSNDIKRTGMQKRLFYLERTEAEDGGAKQELSGIFSYDAMSELSVPVVLRPSRGVVGGGNNDDKGYDDNGYHFPTIVDAPVKEMSPIHPLVRTYYTFRNVCKWDKENERILKLALPYVFQALVTGVAEAARVGILAGLYDTRSMSAYVICVMLIGFTAEFFGGILDAQGVLTAQSIGMGNTKLTGQYTQAGMILFIVSVIPITIIWMFVMGPVLRWFGFDEETVQLGVEFTQSYVWAEVVMGVDGSLQVLLDISGHEIYSAIFTSIREVTVTLTILIAALVTDNVELKHVGYMFLVNMIIFFIFNVSYIAYMGFWRKYYSGLLFCFALANLKVSKRIISTAIPLSFGYLLTYGEWEILTIFAAFIGPAEVATWGILGTLWDVLEDATEAIAEAAEVRCACLLGSGKPIEAKMSSYKSILLAFIVSSLLSSLVLIWGNDLSQLTTSEETLHFMVNELIPLFAVGNIALAVGSMSWTLVGAQGRYGYSTIVGFVGSWCVTVPLAAIFSIKLGIDLQGQTSAVVIGYMVSGTWNTFTLLRSDWKQISDSVIEYNTSHNIDVVDDGSSSDEEEEKSEDSVNDANATEDDDTVVVEQDSFTRFQCYHV